MSGGHFCVISEDVRIFLKKVEKVKLKASRIVKHTFKGLGLARGFKTFFSYLVSTLIKTLLLIFYHFLLMKV